MAENVVQLNKSSARYRQENRSYFCNRRCWLQQIYEVNEEETLRSFRAYRNPR